VIPANDDARDEGETPPRPGGALRAAALNLAKRGLPVFPCAAHGKTPLTKNGFLDASQDARDIQAWWNIHPDANIGVATGAAGLVVIDIDEKNGGFDSLRKLTRLHGMLETITVLTGGGGEHRYFKAIPDTTIKSRSNAFGPAYPGIDVRATGGYVIAPPSIHPNGRAYAWEASNGDAMATLPEWAARLLAGPDRTPIRGVDNEEKIDQGGRHAELMRLAGRLRRLNTAGATIYDTVSSVNQRQCVPPIPDKDVEHIVNSAMQYPAVEFLVPPGHGEEPVPEPEWADSYPWPKLRRAAFYGLIGEIVDALEPQTEADPAAMVISLLVACGNIAGATTYATHLDNQHPARIFATIVGGSGAEGRKGTSWATVRPVVREAFPEWFHSCLRRGFGSGEALIEDLFLLQETDPNADVRLLCIEEEIARLYVIGARDGATISMTFRNAYDSGDLEHRLRKKQRFLVKGAHISVIGHITPFELNAKLSHSDLFNGYANRFLYCCSRSSKDLPSGGVLDPQLITYFATRLRRALSVRPRILRRSPAAEELWDQIYAEHKAALLTRGPVAAALTARFDAHILRLSVAFAVVDEAPEIRAEHVRAADAVWRYHVGSVEYIFRDQCGSLVQDTLLGELRRVYPEGLSGAAQDALFKGNLKAGELPAARAALEQRHLIRTAVGESGEKGGRRPITSFAISRRETEQLGLTARGDSGAELIPVNPYPSVENDAGDAGPVATDTEDL